MQKIKIALALGLALPLLAFAHGGVDDETLIIKMTDNGFEPQELTVVEGDTVTFVNEDDVDRWPASNLHPTHGIYPEFDPQKGLPPGQSWQFTFNKIGTWKMHDHLIPKMTGAITVLADLESGSSSSGSEEGFWEKLKNFFLRLVGKRAY